MQKSFFLCVFEFPRATASMVIYSNEKETLELLSFEWFRKRNDLTSTRIDVAQSVAWFKSKAKPRDQ